MKTYLYTMCGIVATSAFLANPVFAQESRVGKAPKGALVFENDPTPSVHPKTRGVVTSIDIPASRFVRGQNVAMATGQVASSYGSDVLMNAPPYQGGPNAAEFEFRVNKPGVYRLSARYAAATSRPLVLSLNGHQISITALGSPTGCWEARCQKWIDQGEVTLSRGTNILRLYTASVFPHITALRLVPVNRSR